jgi:tetratricopeptide (TPR) repeat protein
MTTTPTSSSTTSPSGARHPLSRRLSALTLSALLAVGPGGVANVAHAQEDDFSFDIVEEGVKDTDTARIEQAKELVADERYDEAIGVMEGILQEKGLARFHQATEYDIAKTFYRMGAYHMALLRFQKILDAGPKHQFFAQSRNWLFFIARKTKDELAALQMVSTYTKAEDIPADQQSELSYALARFYFLMALNQGAKGVEVEQSSDEPEPAPEPTPDTPTTEEPPPATDTTDDGFNFSADDLGGGEDDGFGFDFSGAETKKETKKPKKPKKPTKKDKENIAKDPPKETATPTVTTPEPPKKASKEKSHKNENPQSAEASLEAALAAVKRVDKNFALYSQATYLRGLVHFARGEFEPAVKAFRDVVRMTNPRAAKDGEQAVENAKLREMAFFSLARIHYQFEQFRYAIFYYDRISRDSEAWLEAVFESSWAHFRLGEYEKALGNLVTLQSPFFAGEYYPESSILKAITFYENCRYPEARAFLAEFNQNYGGVLSELDRLVGATPSDKGEAAAGGEKQEQKTAEQLFEELTDLEKKVAEGKDDAASSIALTARLLRLALSDKRVAGFKAAIDEIDEEKARLAAMPAPFAGGPMATELQTGLDARRGELVTLAGTLLRDKLLSERQFLSDLKSKLFRIQFQIIKREKETLEASLSNQSQTVSLGDYNFTTATDDERLFWPFEGEYWRDELGTYQYTLTKGCRPPSEGE